MTTQLTLQGLLDALASMEQNATLMLTGFGPASYPGTLFRHRPFVDGLAIEPCPNRARSMSAAQYADHLRAFGMGLKAETFRRRPFEDQHPAGPETPMWVGMPHEVSFHAVTGVEMMKGFAVIRTTNLAPEQGPSILRLSEEEAINRMRVEYLRRTGQDTVFAPAAERQLLRMAVNDRSDLLHRLDEARHDLTSFEQSLQAKKDRVAKLEEDVVRNEYLLGIRDDLPGDEPGCNGLCHRASDVGVYAPGDPVAYAHNSCPEHGKGAGDE